MIQSLWATHCKKTDLYSKTLIILWDWLFFQSQKMIQVKLTIQRFRYPVRSSIHLLKSCSLWNEIPPFQHIHSCPSWHNLILPACRTFLAVISCCVVGSIPECWLMPLIPIEFKKLGHIRLHSSFQKICQWYWRTLTNHLSPLRCQICNNGCDVRQSLFLLFLCLLLFHKIKWVKNW